MWQIAVRCVKVKVYGDMTYYTAQALLFIPMAMMLFSTRNRNLKRAEVEAPE